MENVNQFCKSCGGPLNGNDFDHFPGCSKLHEKGTGGEITETEEGRREREERYLMSLTEENEQASIVGQEKKSSKNEEVAESIIKSIEDKVALIIFLGRRPPDFSIKQTANASMLLRKEGIIRKEIENTLTKEIEKLEKNYSIDDITAVFLNIQRNMPEMFKKQIEEISLKWEEKAIDKTPQKIKENGKDAEGLKKAIFEVTDNIMICSGFEKDEKRAEECAKKIIKEAVEKYNVHSSQSELKILEDVEKKVKHPFIKKILKNLMSALINLMTAGGIF